MQDLLAMLASFLEVGAHLGRVPLALARLGARRAGRRPLLLGARDGGQRQGKAA